MVASATERVIMRGVGVSMCSDFSPCSEGCAAVVESISSEDLIRITCSR